MNPAPDCHQAQLSLCCRLVHLAGPVVRAVVPLSWPVCWWAGIATSYRLDGPGDRFPVGARFDAPVQTDPADNPASCTTGTGSLFREVKRPVPPLTTHPASSAEVKERAKLYLYPPLWAFMAFPRSNFTLHLFSIVHCVGDRRHGPSSSAVKVTAFDCDNRRSGAWHRDLDRKRTQLLI